MIGFGSQARAWALNLRDSGYQVIIALRSGSPSTQRVKDLGFEVKTLGTEALPKKAPLLLLIPDHLHHGFLEKHHKDITPGTKIIYGHGYSLIKS